MHDPALSDWLLFPCGIADSYIFHVISKLILKLQSNWYIQCTNFQGGWQDVYHPQIYLGWSDVDVKGRSARTIHKCANPPMFPWLVTFYASVRIRCISTSLLWSIFWGLFSLFCLSIEIDGPFFFFLFANLDVMRLNMRTRECEVIRIIAIWVEDLSRVSCQSNA